MTHILYINDNNLRLQRLAHDDQHSFVYSKGYAWFKGEEVIFDTDASNAPVKYCRLAPQEMNSRYWQQCGKASVSTNSAGMRHAADLVWKHLSELKKGNSIERLVLVVPSHYQSSNLQLLLGIVQSLSIEVIAIVNGALLSVYDKLEHDGQYAHVDVQLHQTVISYINVLNGVAKLGDVEIVQSVGIQAMQDTLLKTLQTHFIQNDRFDPLHNAETEQQLFDNLSDVAVQVNEFTKTVVSVSFQSQLYSSNIDAKAWNGALKPFTDKLLAIATKVEQAYVQMNASFGHASLPAMHSSKVTLLNELVLSDVSEFISSDDVDGSLSYITEIKATQDIAEKSSSMVTSGNKVSRIEEKKSTTKKTEKESAGPTHLLQLGVAVPIEDSEIIINGQEISLKASAKGNVQMLLETNKLFILNDESRNNLRPNDRIGSHIVDGVITVIQVL